MPSRHRLTSKPKAPGSWGKIAAARSLLSRCGLCPRKCRIDRRVAADGICRTGIRGIMQFTHDHIAPDTCANVMSQYRPCGDAHKTKGLDWMVSVFKPKTVVCHAGYDPTRYDFCKKEWLAHAAAAWQWLAKELHKRGSRLMLENVYEKDPQELLQLLETLDPDHAGHCLDVGHLAAFGKYQLDQTGKLGQWLDATGNYVGQFHLHDNRGDHDSHLGMGKDTIDFRPVFEFVRTATPKPIITLEPHKKEDFITSLAFLEQFDFLSLFS